MKTRLITFLCAALALSALSAAPVEKAEPNPTVTTIKRSAIQVGNSSFALVKGTKLQVIGREGKLLIVKYRTSQGKIPYADTDYVLSEEEQLAEEEAAGEAAATPPQTAPAKPPAPPLPAVSKKTAGPTPGGQPIRQAHGPEPVAGQPTTVPAPPALSTNPADKQPATNYGKAVQKTKQVEQAHKEKLVNPTDEILDEKPKK